MFKRNKNYHVSFADEDTVTPEETLLDSNSQYSVIEKPISGSIFIIFNVIFGVAFLIILILGFRIAIIENDLFVRLAFQNKSANFPLAAPRGLVFDRFGKPLAKNILSFNLLAVSRQLKENRDSMDSGTGKIAQILGIDAKEFRNKIVQGIKKGSTFLAFENLGKDQAVDIQFLNLPGFYVIYNTQREYISGLKFAHIIGYTGKVNQEDG